MPINANDEILGGRPAVTPAPSPKPPVQPVGPAPVKPGNQRQEIPMPTIARDGNAVPFEAPALTDASS